MDVLSVKRPLFGKEVEIILFDVDEFLVAPIIEEVYEDALRLSRIFNFYDPDSELSRLNSKRKLKVSGELLQVLKCALSISSLTQGQYDITLGKMFKQRKEGVAPKILSCSYEDIIIVGNQVSLAHPDVQIDLGSIAKGFIADSMARHFMREGVDSGIIDARGDIRVFGDAQRVIGIQHPRDDEGIIRSVTIGKGAEKAIATSGDYNQYHSDFDECHILNKKDLISVTVAADDLFHADAFATAIFVCSQGLRERLINENPGLRVLVVDKGLGIRCYNGFDAILVKNVEN